MITAELTPHEIAEMRETYEKYRPALRPNRKSGTEVDRYFRDKYEHLAFESPEFQSAVCGNITENEFSRAKLPIGAQPDIKCYITGGVLVGIDLISGEFHVEAEDMKRAAVIYDDLFVYRGLDAADLDNFVITAEYVKLCGIASADASAFDIHKFWRCVLEQDADGIREFFHTDGYVNWHCTNEHFTAAEFIRANCEYPGQWDGEIERIENIGDLIITVTHVYPKNRSSSFHVTSFFKIRGFKIASLDEYWADDGDAPEWRRHMHIGKPIICG